MQKWLWLLNTVVTPINNQTLCLQNGIKHSEEKLQLYLAAVWACVDNDSVLHGYDIYQLGASLNSIVCFVVL